MTHRLHRSYRFNHTLSRRPGNSIADGIRMTDSGNPDPDVFADQHAAYLEALAEAGVDVHVLPSDEAFPDSVFIEDAAICVDGAAILTRPGALSRRDEPEGLRVVLGSLVDSVLDLPGTCTLDGGDVLLTETDAMIGLSDRTDASGYDALAELLSDFGYTARKVITPPEVLHFKSDCGLLDENTIFATEALASTGCFEDYSVITAPVGEEAAANLIRVNDLVLVNAGFPKTAAVLAERGYAVETVDTSEAALVDGGLSCLSLRFFLAA